MAARARRDSDPPPDPAARARSIALRLLDRAPRSATALREALIAREVDESTADEIVARYREVGLIDDRALAVAIARSRQATRGHARPAIARELRRRGFGADDVEAAIDGITPDDEAEAAEAFVRRRWRALASLEPEKRARRLVSALARRGYSPGAAFALVRGFESADIWDNRVGEVTPGEEV